MNHSLDFLISNLPSPLALLIRDHPTIQELRLCLNAPVLIVEPQGRKASGLICTKELLDDALAKLTEHSFYSHEDTVKEGYLSLPYGIRVGICGRAICKRKEITAIKDVSFLCIRVPHSVKGIALPFYQALKTSRFQKGALLYSLPGVGKTTVLKDLIDTLAACGKFIAVIDQRGEFSSCGMGRSCMIYRHYPKTDAIAMAIKTTTPDMLILDEIGAEECTALMSCALSGVPVIASAHAEYAQELICRPGFDLLFKHDMFALLVGLTRSGNRMDYHFSSSSDLLTAHKNSL